MCMELWLWLFTANYVVYINVGVSYSKFARVVFKLLKCLY